MASAGYDLKKQRAAARSKAAVLAGQDIGAIPAVRNPLRRALADGDFRVFCESYFPLLFTLAWSEDHLRVMAKIEQAVKFGGLFAMAMPRGSGKTTLCQAAVLWALLTGRQQFVFFICATELYAQAALENLKSHLSGNALLLEDYPEVIYPIRCLEGETRRCSGQRYYGRLTHIGWAGDEIVLPTIPGSKCSGALVRTAGLLGNIRGSLHIRPDGSSIRPTLVVIDDPQTDGSARSPSQVHERLAVINGAILNLAGPGKQIGAIMPCTVIRKDDLADQVLDRNKSPDWQGERTKLVYAFPTNEKLWGEYARIRAESLRNDGDAREATRFYVEHKAEMDAGAKVAWKERYGPGEVSAIQNAMNLKLRDEAAFWAEYQNDPLPDQEMDASLMTAAEIAAKTNGMKRGEVPENVTRLTAFVDIQGSLLYWMVCGWEEDFTGYVLDYGSYPDQKRAYYTLKDAKRTLQWAHPGTGQDGAIYAGLEALTNALLGREFVNDQGEILKVERQLIDANWGDSTDVVYQFCRQSPHRAILLPSHGRYVGASGQPFDEYKRKPGDRVGLHWRIPSIRGQQRAIRHAIYDTNYWKSFAHTRLKVAKGDPSCLSLFQPGDGFNHTMLAEQLTAEYRVKTEGRGRTVDEFKIKPSKPDNHLLDCLVGCLVGASILGIKRNQDGEGKATRRMSFSEMQRRKRQRRETANG